MRHAHPARWLTAAPLWTESNGMPGAQPALLRFRTDAFMDELAGILAGTPAQLRSVIAAPQPGTTETVKLFQPVHGEFPLVAASLVCSIPGLPDRKVDRPVESVGFVLRQLDSSTESAWVTGPSKRWQSVAGQPDFLAQNEETFPLFPVTFGNDRRRCLHVGLVPTSSRDTVLEGAVEIPKLPANDQIRYVIRCVLQPASCPPSQRPLLSDPSTPFAIAPYFDPDAPARTIRITLPADPSNLLGFKKNVGFAMSVPMRNKTNQAKVGLNEMLKGNEGTKGTDTEGEICSVSIPIISLCATIVLTLFLQLLDIIFKWKDNFRICATTKKGTP